MAGYPAIAATGQAIVGLLSSAAPGSEFATATFALASSIDLQKTPAEQPVANVYLYRIAVNTTRRNLPPRRDPDGRLRMPPVPVDLHYLLISSAKVPVTQHRLLGWCIRVIQDTPTLNAGFLNQFGPETNVFRPDETVELIWDTLTRQEMADAWEIAKANQQPSVSYIARIVEIESRVDLTEYPPVQTTDLRYAGDGAAMIVAPGPVIGPELERIVSVVPFGFRLWDPVVGRAVSQDLEVTWRTPSGRRLPVSSSPSGAFALRHLPGNDAFEHGAGDHAFWASPPAGPAIGTVEVRDPLGRYLPFSFSPDGPGRVGQLAREACGLPAGGILGLSGGSPPERAMPVLPLFSAASRIAPQGMARLSAQLETADGVPAAGAILRVSPPGEAPTFGLADGRGVVTALVPYPRPAQPWLSPPPGAGSNASQHWDNIAVSVFWAAAPLAPSPDLCDLLSQIDASPVAILASQSPDTELTSIQLDVGVPVDLRTFPLSVLIVEAGPPPSP